MFSLSHSHSLPIGVDLGHDSVKILQLETTADGHSILCAARQRVPDATTSVEKTNAAIETMRRLLARYPFRGRKIVTTLPRELLHVRSIRVAAPTAEGIAKLLPGEVRGAFPFDASEANARVHCIATGEVRVGGDIRREMLCFAARHHDVDPFIERMHAAGVIVVRLEPDPIALFRCFRKSHSARLNDAPDVMVDIGDRRTQVLIARGSAISFYKSIDIGASHLHGAVSRKLGISLDDARALRMRLIENSDPNNPRAGAVRNAVFDATRGIAEELAREVGMCLRYHAVTVRGPRPRRVLFSGGEALDPQLHAVLKAALDVTIEAARPFDAIDSSSVNMQNNLGPLSDWALATGLALRCAEGVETAPAPVAEVAHV